MGTEHAPDTTITMPSPSREVSRATAMLKARGSGHVGALRRVWAVAQNARATLRDAGIDDAGWLEAIAHEAWVRHGALSPVTTTGRGLLNGDKSTAAPAGRPAG